MKLHASGEDYLEAILMTIPFRCAPRHQREMKHSASNAASQNLLEYA